jgi:pimeloyl-ACP methyl ester carboxylesterase
VKSNWIVLEGESAGPVHYADFGGSGPPVVLVHGLGGSHANWVEAGARVARFARVVALDLAGFGRTPLAGRAASIEANARLLRAFTERFAREHGAGHEGVTLVGNSMGGLLSAMVAGEAEALVDRVVLVDASLPRVPGVSIDREVASAFALYAIPRVGEAFLKARHARLSPEALVHETLRLCCARTDGLSPALLEAHYAIARERRAMEWANAAFLAAARSVLTLLLRPQRFHAILEKLLSPTLVVHGTEDRLVPVGQARAAARQYGFALEVLDGIGHVPQIECPARLAEIVRDFLEGDAAVRPSTPYGHAPRVPTAPRIATA